MQGFEEFFNKRKVSPFCIITFNQVICFSGFLAFTRLHEENGQQQKIQWKVVNRKTENIYGVDNDDPKVSTQKRFLRLPEHIVNKNNCKLFH